MFWTFMYLVNSVWKSRVKMFLEKNLPNYNWKCRIVNTVWAVKKEQFFLHQKMIFFFFGMEKEENEFPAFENREQRQNKKEVKMF